MYKGNKSQGTNYESNKGTRKNFSEILNDVRAINVEVYFCPSDERTISYILKKKK